MRTLGRGTDERLGGGVYRNRIVGCVCERPFVEQAGTYRTDIPSCAGEFPAIAADTATNSG